MNATKPHKGNDNVRAAIQISEAHHFSGPLPRPEDLKKYDDILPGAAERIISMAENESRHRHESERRADKAAIGIAVAAIIAAFIAMLLLTGAVFYALYKGYQAVAGTIAVGAIAAVVGAFLFKAKNPKKTI